MTFSGLHILKAIERGVTPNFKKSKNNEKKFIKSVDMR